MSRRATFVVLVGVWCAALAVGLCELHAYETSPGGQGVAPTRWPADSTLPGSRTGITLVMFIHPECPCTRASIAELRSLPIGQHRLVLVYSDDRGAGWDLGADVEGAVRVVDRSGVEERRFGVRTSGHMVVYLGDQLAFSGGITGSRGHQGDNVGRRKVAAILDGSASATTNPVFGCGLGRTR